MDVLEKTRVVGKGVKESRLTVLGALAVKISEGEKKSYQILYITRETKQLILSQTCLEQLGLVLGSMPGDEDGDMLHVEGQGVGANAACGCLARSEVPELPKSMPEQAKSYSVEDLEQ